MTENASTPSGFDPSRITEALEGVEGRLLQPIIRKAADEFYCTALEAAEDYLRDNLDHNLKSHLSTLERENQRMRTELHEVDMIVGPPWLTHPERLKRLQEMNSARSEVVALRYQAAMRAEKLS